MAKIKDNVRPSLPPIPGGCYLGICVYSIGVGEQLCVFEDKSKSYNNQVLMGFEICGMTVEIDGKQEPRVLGKTFNISKSKKSTLRKFISAWEAKEFSDEAFMEVDTNDYVGRPAMLTVVLNDTGEYSNIDNIAPLPIGLPIEVPKPMSTLIRFDMDPWDQKAFDALPDWAKDRIKKSTEYQKEHLPAETVTVQGTQQPQGAAFQMPQNIPGLNFQGAMQMPGAGAAVSQATAATGSFMQGVQPQQVVQQPVQAPQQVQGFVNTGAPPVQGGGVVPF